MNYPKNPFIMNSESITDNNIIKSLQDDIQKSIMGKIPVKVTVNPTDGRAPFTMTVHKSPAEIKAMKTNSVKQEKEAATPKKDSRIFDENIPQRVSRSPEVTEAKDALEVAQLNLNETNMKIQRYGKEFPEEKADREKYEAEVASATERLAEANTIATDRITNELKSRNPSGFRPKPEIRKYSPIPEADKVAYMVEQDTGKRISEFTKGENNYLVGQLYDVKYEDGSQETYCIYRDEVRNADTEVLRLERTKQPDNSTIYKTTPIGNTSEYFPEDVANTDKIQKKITELTKDHLTRKEKERASWTDLEAEFNESFIKRGTEYAEYIIRSSREGYSARREESTDFVNTSRFLVNTETGEIGKFKGGWWSEPTFEGTMHFDESKEKWIPIAKIK